MNRNAFAQNIVPILFLAFVAVAAILLLTFLFYAAPYMIITGTDCAPMPWASCK